MGARPERGSLAARAQVEIERLIMSGELHGGDRVNEIALADRLGTSRGPVREACRALVQEGLLVAEPNRGVFVRELDIRDVLDVYDIRAALDDLMGQLITDRVTPGEVAALEDLTARMQNAAEHKDLETYYPLNLAFHDLLLTACRNERLATLYKGLVKELHLFRRRGLLQFDSMRISNAEHRQIVTAIATRNPIAAGLAMKGHVVAAKQRLMAAIAAEMAAE